MAAPVHGRIIRTADATALAEAAAERVLARISENSGRVAICLTGGSSPKRLYALLAQEPYRSRIPWARVHWFIGDERLVPPGDELHNMSMARQIFLDQCAPAANIHPIPTDLATTEDCARAYERELKSFYGADQLDDAKPLFDLVLLGVGPDGHVASMFPNYPAIDERERWVVGVATAPVAPPVQRITLTLPPLGSCREMLFQIAGADKRAILTRVLAGENLPANRARATGETVWLVDNSALPEEPVETEGQAPCALVVMGVSGAGKSTVGEELAARLGWRYEDGDKFHPESNVAKMRAGHPLTDEDRWPWLRAIGDEIDRVCGAASHVVIACSALKRAYRDVLLHGRSDVRLVYLDGSEPLIGDRLSHRKGHFMPPGLLASQFATLEPPAPEERAVRVSIDAPVQTIVDDILKQLGLERPEASTS